MSPALVVAQILAAATLIQDLPVGAQNAVGPRPPAAWLTIAQTTAALPQASESKPKDGQKDKAKDKSKPKEKDKNGFVWKDRPSLRFGDMFRMDFRLKLQADFWSSPDPTTVDEGALDMSRRRVGIKGFVFKDLEYEVEHDLRSDGEWRDVYVNAAYLPYAQAQIGKFKIPFSLEALTGPTDLDFVFRTRAVDALSCGRDIGAMAHGQVLKKAVHYQVAYFQHDGERPPALEPTYPDDPLPADARQPAMAVRGTVAPFRLAGVKGALKSLVVGAAMVSTDVPEGPNHLQGQSASGYHFFPRQYLTAGRRLRTGFEFAWTPGPAGIKAEYLSSSEAREGVGVGTPDALDQTLPELVGRGWYVSGTWVLTGERKEGGIVPKRPLFQGGFGAIEAGARYEALRFSSAVADGPPSDSRRSPTVLPNAEHALTIGVSWYVNKWIKIQMNGIQESFDDPSRSPLPDRASFWSTVWRVQFVL